MEKLQIAFSENLRAVITSTGRKYIFTPIKSGYSISKLENNIIEDDVFLTHRDVKEILNFITNEV